MSSVTDVFFEQRAIGRHNRSKERCNKKITGPRRASLNTLQCCAVTLLTVGQWKYQIKVQRHNYSTKWDSSSAKYFIYFISEKLWRIKGCILSLNMWLNQLNMQQVKDEAITKSIDLTKLLIIQSDTTYHFQYTFSSNSQKNC